MLESGPWWASTQPNPNFRVEPLATVSSGLRDVKEGGGNGDVKLLV
ncbi:MAG TPA: hypothetical protein VF905_11085 [Nitrospirota bacterium]